MMKWILYDFKSARESWFEEAEATYLKKIKPFVEFDIQHLKTKTVERRQAQIKIKFEESVLLEKLNTGDYIILFDENGRQLDSMSFASAIAKAQSSGKKRGVFIIGGAYGLGDQIKKKATISISLSSFVLNHLIAETVFLEQFYRAQTILNRIPYHNL